MIIDQFVECLIEANLFGYGTTFDGRPATPDEILPCRPERGTNGSGRDRLSCRPPGSQPVQNRPDVVVLAHSRQVEAGHTQTPAPRVLDQTVRLQQRHGLLDGLSGDTESLGKLILHEVGTR